MNIDELKAQLAEAEERLANIAKTLPEHLAKDWTSFDEARFTATQAKVAGDNANHVESRMGNGVISSEHAATAHHNAGMTHLDAAKAMAVTGHYDEAKKHADAAMSHFASARRLTHGE